MASYFRNPVISQPGMDHGDPFAMSYLGRYYLYHTGGSGVHLHTSTDLVNWRYEGTVLAPKAECHWAQVDYWAPEVMYSKGTFYMYVSGTKRTAKGGDDALRRLGIARSKSPLGPFEWDEHPLFDEWSIDAHPYRDDNGSLWLFYNIRTEETRYVDGTTGCGNVVEAMSAPDQAVGNQMRVTFPTEPWEGDKKGTWYWNEGPTVLKRRGTYYQMYSGGCYRDETYAIGVATAPSPLGPWTKYPRNPIFTSTSAISGPGHHSVVLGPDGVNLYAVYHGRIPQDAGRKVHIDRLFWVGDHLKILGPTEEEQKVPSGPVYDPQVPHWKATAWVRGTQVEFCGLRLSLADEGYQYLQVSYSCGLVTVYLDQKLKYAGLVNDNGFVPTCDGTIVAITQTSCLDDANVYELALGQNHSWHFGGNSPVDVSLAIKGSARVYADDVLMWEGHSDSFTLVRFITSYGVNEIRVVADSRQATVTDLLVTAMA
ncbi:MAG: glycoside hydrolase family 43 protein [Limnochordia bacterium]|nr:glycoside hydrolase family 43 protein [Limnochordia bacterium]